MDKDLIIKITLEQLDESSKVFDDGSKCMYDIKRMIVNQLKLLSRTNFGMIAQNVCRNLSSQIGNADDYGYKLKQLSDDLIMAKKVYKDADNSAQIKINDIIYTGETEAADTLKDVWRDYKKEPEKGADIFGAAGDMLKDTVKVAEGGSEWLYKHIENLFSNPMKELSQDMSKLILMCMGLTNPTFGEAAFGDIGKGIEDTIKRNFQNEVVNGDEYSRDKYISSIALWTATAGIPAAKALKGLSGLWKADEIGETGEDIEKVSEGVSKAPEITAENPLPNFENANIDPRKLTDYALNPDHPVGGNKARVFDSALGYNQSNSDELLNQVYEKLPSSESVLGKADQYGQRYTVDMQITGPNGNTATVRTGWIIKPGSTTPEMTTIYVK